MASSPGRNQDMTVLKEEATVPEDAFLRVLHEVEYEKFEQLTNIVSNLGSSFHEFYGVYYSMVQVISAQKEKLKAFEELEKVDSIELRETQQKVNHLELRLAAAQREITALEALNSDYVNRNTEIEEQLRNNIAKLREECRLRDNEVNERLRLKEMEIEEIETWMENNIQQTDAKLNKLKRKRGEDQYSQTGRSSTKTQHREKSRKLADQQVVGQQRDELSATICTGLACKKHNPSVTDGKVKSYGQRLDTKAIRSLRSNPTLAYKTPSIRTVRKRARAVP